jgi:uncharacterized protein YdeI (YjbR/CyaY-like superfamily)
MQEPGEAAMARAVANGSWTLLDSIEALEAPDDLAAALKADPIAAAGYEVMPDGAKRELLRRVVLAKRPETRARKISEAIEEARGRADRVSGT